MTSLVDSSLAFDAGSRSRQADAGPLPPAGGGEAPAADRIAGSIADSIATLFSQLEQLLARPSVLDRYLPAGERATAPPARSPEPALWEVKAGDTLGAIARRTGTSVAELARVNGLADPDRLAVGQVLKLPPAAPAPTATTAPTATAAPAAASAAAGSSTPAGSGLSPAGTAFLYAHEAQAGVSNHLHWPGGASGVTLGPGYDMKGRTAGEVQQDLVAIGIDAGTARDIAAGAGLEGAAARDFARDHKDLVSLTPAQEQALLARAVAPFAQTVGAAVTVPLSQNQFDALVSFAYNIGGPAFRGSTALARLNAGDTAGAAEAMGWWNKSNGAVVPGLVNRRADEIALFQTAGPAGAPATAAPALASPPAPAAGDLSPDALAATVATRGDAAARADLAAGHKVVVALRTDTQTGANGGKGVYDDRIAVVWKDAAGRYQARLFAGNTEPSAQYGSEGPKADRGSHTDMDGDGRMDLGRLQAGTIRYERAAGTFLGNSFFRAAHTQVAERDTNHDGRFTAADADRIDPSGAGRSMLIHQGGTSNTWSAGCQTIPKAEYDDFLAALGNQKAFSYVLVDAAR